MDLRQKFGVLALIYVLSLTANLVMSGWCILVYFQSAFSDSQSALGEKHAIERLRGLARRQKQMLEHSSTSQEAIPRLASIADEWRAIAARIEQGAAGGADPELWDQVAPAIEAMNAHLDGRSGRATGADFNPAPSGEEERVLAEIDRILAGASSTVSRQRESNVERAAATQQRVVRILIANAGVGAVLCALGLVFVRRWVLRPVADLRAAALEIARGNLEYRIAPRSNDELGKLASEVNQMSATIAQMQTKLVEQERLAAAGEMVTRVAHNIRNPLAGIRGLAESTLGLAEPDTEAAAHQQRIIESVDRFEKWLRDLQQSVSPLSLNPRPTSMNELVESVTRALRPMADRRSVPLEISIDPALGPVHVDGIHFEQALVALITNAVQASPAGRPVRIMAAPLADHSGRWRLEVRDQGAGVPAELHRKIFLPYFTTKPDGHGVGLAMASKVVRIHGGHLSVESALGAGSVFTALMPGRGNGN